MRVRLYTSDSTDHMSYFDLGSLDDPDVSWINDQLIIHNLDKIYRMCGRGLGVDYHSAILAKLFSSEKDPSRRLALQWYALLHDTSEIITNDVPSPVKQWLPSSFSDMEYKLVFRIIWTIYQQKNPAYLGRIPTGLNPSIVAEVGAMDKTLGDLEFRGIEGFDPNFSVGIYFKQILNTPPDVNELFIWSE